MNVYEFINVVLNRVKNEVLANEDGLLEGGLGLGVM